MLPPPLSANIQVLGNSNLTVGLNSPTTAVSYFWDFGDGSSSNFRSPVHTYSLAGYYKITLKVTDSQGTEATKSINLLVTKPTIAEIFWTKNDYELEFHFDSIGNSDLSGLKYFWDFGDGSTSELKNPTHMYLKQNEYQVSLTVTRDNAPGVSYTTKVYANKKLISYSDLFGLRVQFQSLMDAPQYYWDFGDGTYSNEKNPLHFYLKGGAYKVKLAVISASGDQFTDELDVQVLSILKICSYGMSFSPIHFKIGGLGNFDLATGECKTFEDIDPTKTYAVEATADPLTYFDGMGELVIFKVEPYLGTLKFDYFLQDFAILDKNMSNTIIDNSLYIKYDSKPSYIP